MLIEHIVGTFRNAKRMIENISFLMAKKKVQVQGAANHEE
jgi:hypothetical protein